MQNAYYNTQCVNVDVSACRVQCVCMRFYFRGSAGQGAQAVGMMTKYLSTSEVQALFEEARDQIREIHSS